jgi:hypothetical protein
VGGGYHALSRGGRGEEDDTEFSWKEGTLGRSTGIIREAGLFTTVAYKPTVKPIFSFIHLFREERQATR